MKVFEANFATIMIRYYLMMAVVIGSFVSGISYLSILAIPIFLSALLGVSFRSSFKEVSVDEPVYYTESGMHQIA